jgi:putative ABC transport system permease protein
MHDLRLALRQLGKSPGLTFIAVLTLALGIGANTAIFTLVNSVLFRPLPYPQSERLVQIWRRSEGGEPLYASGHIFKLWRDNATLLESIAALDSSEEVVTGGAGPEQFWGYLVSANYLRVLQIRLALGSDFSADADRFGGPNRVVIISHALWHSRFGGDPAVINQALRLNGVDHTIVGVLPPKALMRDDIAFLRPLVLDAPTPSQRTAPRGDAWGVVLARLKPGVTPGQLAAELIQIREAHLAELPLPVDKLDPFVVPLREQLTGASRPTLLLLSLAGGLVLVIACANVANLLLVRAIARRREFAVRLALGAPPGRIVRQTLCEGFLLALLAAAVAAVAAMYCTDFLGSVAQAVQPQLSNLQRGINDKITGSALPPMMRPEVDWAVLGFSLVAAAFTTVLSSLAPALRACRTDVLHDLQLGPGRGSSGARSRLQALLIAGQVGLTAMLLVCAGLLLRSFGKVLAVDPGFDVQQTLAFRVALPAARFQAPEHAVSYVEDMRARLAALPGVAGVGTTSFVPFRFGGSVAIGLASAPDRDRDIGSSFSYVHPDTFRTMGIALRRGRLFTTADNAANAERTLLINETLARDLFREQDPLGQQLFWRNSTWTVVGIVRDVRMRSLEIGGQRHVYAPGVHAPRTVSFILRTQGSPAALLESVRQAVRAFDPEQPLSDLRPIAHDIGRSLHGKRATLALVAVFGGVALALACIGIYSVLAFTVRQRERELGIRLALGAPGQRVLALVLRDGLRLALIGLVLGLLAALASGRLLASHLFGVSPHDPLVFISVTLVLLAAAVAACVLPARRATRVDPIVALRAD